ncbi:MAG: diguanylate cyclase, partial [Oscillospiraceae bacterium]
MKKKSKYIIRDITLFFFVILVTACLLFLTIGTLNRLIDQQSKEHAYTTLREESLYNTKELKDTFKDEEDMLKMLAENVCDNKDNFETIKRLLENGVNNSVYSMIAVTDKEGNSYCSDGNHKTVAKQDFFVRSLRGETVLSKPVLDEKTGEYYVVLSVPIIDDTKIVGTLRGAYKYEKWEKALANNVFSETGFFRIVDVDGNIIVSTSASDKKNNVKNIFLSDENIRPLSNEGTTENIKQNFKDSKSDACVMRIDNTDRYGFYQPVGFNQWYIISGVSPNFADVMNNITKRKSQKALGFIFFVIILLILFVIWQNRKQNKSLLFNKGYLESIIESIQGGVVVNSLDPDFKVIFASEGATVISGYTSTEVINKPNLDFVYADDREKVNEHIKRLVNGIDDKLSVEYRLVRKDGSRIWVLERGRILKNIKGIPFMHSVFMDIDAQKNLENELKINEKSYKIAIENSGLIMFEYNILNKTFVFFDETGEKNIDDLEKFKTLESILENSHLDEKNKKVLYDCYKKINEGSKMEENTVRWFGNDKKEVIFRTKITTVFDNDEKAISAIGVGRDITSLYMLEKERAFTKIIESENNLSFTANLEKKTITDGSSTWFDMGEIHSGMVFEHVVAEIANTIIHKDDRSRVVTELNSEYLKKLYENNVLSHNVEYRRMLDNNEYIWVETEIKMFNDPFNDELMADFFIHNINDKKLKQLALIEKAEHDGLTGIYNRITAQTMIDNYLKTCDIMSAKSAFLILDIDKFKNFNDTFGHMFGDEILRECANKLKILFRDDDILGRLGGDEFIV